MKSREKILEMNPIELRAYMFSEEVSGKSEFHNCRDCNNCKNCNVLVKKVYYCCDCKHVEDSAFCYGLEGEKENPKRYHICNVSVGEEAYNKKVKEIELTDSKLGGIRGDLISLSQ